LIVAAGSFWVRVAGLRRMLNQADGARLLQCVAPGYRLRIASTDIDVERFFTLLERARCLRQTSPLNDRAEQGLSNAEIANRLYISLFTAKTHVSRILTKLYALDRAQLVMHAYETRPRRPRQLSPTHWVARS
jgi:Bacterial regulatory proteins, luxR family